MNYIDAMLNRFTMYRVVLYGLCAFVAYAFLLSVFGVLPYAPLALAESLAAILLATGISNAILAKLFDVAPNVESVWITAFILFFTLGPALSVGDLVSIALAGALAMASKYFLAVRKKHVFNPAAAALVILSVAGSGLASWWVAGPVMLPAVAIVGLLIVRKIRRFDAFFAFLGASIAVAASHAFSQGAAIGTVVVSLFMSWPLMFLGTIMLTEPLTMPPSRGLRIVYGVIVGALFVTPFNIGSVYMTPQLALLFGNLYAFFVSSRQKLLLRFKAKEQLSPSVYEFIFEPSEKLLFAAGQYLEWTVPHKKSDTRGNRRYFTVASSASSPEVRLGARIDAKAPSSLKRRLMQLQPGETITAGSLSGDFVLPKQQSRRLVFVAGGVGITPFISMIRTLKDAGEKRDIVLLYLAASEQDFAYHPTLEQARQVLGIRIEYLPNTRLTAESIYTLVPDYGTRWFYLSGPNAMVESYKKLLSQIGVSRSRIKTDYFPGF